MEEKIIGNVNVLDLRNATAESIAEITKIENANLVLYTQGNAGLLDVLEIENANAMVDIPPGTSVQRTIGKIIINREYFRNQVDPVFLLVVGLAIVEADVPVDEIQKGLAGKKL